MGRNRRWFEEISEARKAAKAVSEPLWKVTRTPIRSKKDRETRYYVGHEIPASIAWGAGSIEVTNLK